MTNIVEGYAGKCYYKEWNKSLIYAKESNDETMNHLKILWETEALNNESVYLCLMAELEILGKMLTEYRRTIQKR